jgi:hypothetical protein
MKPRRIDRGAATAIALLLVADLLALFLIAKGCVFIARAVGDALLGAP